MQKYEKLLKAEKTFKFYATTALRENVALLLT